MKIFITKYYILSISLFLTLGLNSVYGIEISPEVESLANQLIEQNLIKESTKGQGLAGSLTSIMNLCTAMGSDLEYLQKCHDFYVDMNKQLKGVIERYHSGTSANFTK